MNPGPLVTENLRLVLPDPAALLSRIDAMPVDDRAQVSPVWLARLRSTPVPDPWILGFSVLLESTGREVGSVGFRSPPGPDRGVEIAYGIDPEHQGQGFATEACRAVTRWALSSGEVDRVCAHTLPDGHASMRVLAKCGFRRIGLVQDPEDGEVIRWETP